MAGSLSPAGLGRVGGSSSSSRDMPGTCRGQPVGAQSPHLQQQTRRWICLIASFRQMDDFFDDIIGSREPGTQEGLSKCEISFLYNI